jgi:phage FluMu protein Com
MVAKHLYRMENHRCHSCGRLLFKGYLAEQTKIEIRCPRCGIMCLYPKQQNGHEKRISSVIDPGEYSVRQLQRMLKETPENCDYSAMVQLEQENRNRKSVLQLLGSLVTD